MSIFYGGYSRRREYDLQYKSRPQLAVYPILNFKVQSTFLVIAPRFMFNLYIIPSLHFVLAITHDDLNPNVTQTQKFKDVIKELLAKIAADY